MFRDNDKNTMRKFLFFKRFSSISQWVFNISESGVYSAEIGINDDRISGINITAEGQNTQLFIRLSSLSGLEYNFDILLIAMVVKVLLIKRPLKIGIQAP